MNFLKPYPLLCERSLGDVVLESHDREYDDACKDRGEGVGYADDERVPQGVAGGLGVAGERYQGPQGQPQREEDLRGRLQPHLRVCQLFPLCKLKEVA